MLYILKERNLFYLYLQNINEIRGLLENKLS